MGGVESLEMEAIKKNLKDLGGVCVCESFQDDFGKFDSRLSRSRRRPEEDYLLRSTAAKTNKRRRKAAAVLWSSGGYLVLSGIPNNSQYPDGFPNKLKEEKDHKKDNSAANSSLMIGIRISN